MLIPLAIALVFALPSAPQADAFREGERLARAGRPHTALQKFEQIVAAHPDDLEARLWLARLLRRVGQTSRAETEFRRVVAAAPKHVEALTGLAELLASRDATGEGLALLDRAETIAPADPGVLAARAQCLRRAGRSREAERLYARAASVSPQDEEIRAGWEQVRRINLHRFEVAFRHEAHGDGRPSAGILDAAADVRRSDALRVHGRMQVQRRFTREEMRAGGGVEWRVRPDTTLRGGVLVGPGADVVARTDVQLEAEHARGRFEVGGAVRRMSFADARAWILAPTLTYWRDDRTALTLRYFGAGTAFDTGRSAFDHSGAVRVRRSVTPRLWLDGSYSRGHESLDSLSADRLLAVPADTWAGALLYHLRGVQSIAAAIEYQRRRGGRTVISLTAAAVHRF